MFNLTTILYAVVSNEHVGVGCLCFLVELSGDGHFCNMQLYKQLKNTLL